MKRQSIAFLSLLLSFLILMSSFSFYTTVNTHADTLPDFSDNSQSKYFPAIGNQGDQGACVCWAQVYYQFTYMMNRSMDVATTPENTFSPTFNYNFSNGGRGQGTWENDVYGIMKEIGNVPLSTVPHNTKEYNNWFPTEEVWLEAMQYRIKDYTIFDDIGLEENYITSPDDTDLYNVKKLLSQGEVLAVTTYISSWDVERIKANPDVPENDKYVDEYVVRLCDGTSERHRLALVGYNDNIWTDVNDNGKVDSGEMGALKIANSWGTDRHNDGFMWIAYDALNKTSCVSGCPTVNYRPAVFHDYTQIEVIPYDSDTDLYFRYTLNTSDRSQGVMYATATKNDGTEYTFEVGPKRQHGMYASTYSYDGTTNANDGTMVWALSNIVPEITSENLHEYSWSFKFEDTDSDGKVFTVKNLEIVDENSERIIKPTASFPFSLDGSSKTLYFPEIEPYIPATTEAYEPTSATTPTTEAITTVAPATNATVPTENVTDATDVTEAQTQPATESKPTDNTTAPATVITTVHSEGTEATEQSTECSSDLPADSTPQNTQATTFSEPDSVSYLVGDANFSGDITISDATIIQKFVANFDVKIDTTAADCDISGKVNIKDATCIQKYLAKLEGYGNTGEMVSESVSIPADATEDPAENTSSAATTASTSTTAVATETTLNPAPTEVPSTVTDPAEIITTVTTSTECDTTASEAVTTTVVTEETTQTLPEPTSAVPFVTEVTTTEIVEVSSNTVTFTNSFGWQGTISCYYWSDDNQTMTAWPGVAMTQSGTNSFGEALFTLEIPENAEYIIFTNGSQQTVDIPYSGGEQKFYPASQNSDGKYTVNNW